MSDFEKKPDRFQVTFSDLLLLLRKYRIKIFTGVLLGAISFILLAAIQPVQYEGYATFRERQSAPSESGKNFSLSLIMGLNDSNENSAIAIMKSRKLMEQVVRKTGLQGTIKEKKLEFNFLTNIKNNFLAEYAHLRKLLHPIIHEPKELLKIHSIHYDAEVPLYLQLKGLDEHRFEISHKDDPTQLIGEYEKPFQGPSYTFILSKTNGGPLVGQEFSLSLMSMPHMSDKLSKVMRVQTELQDKGTLRIFYDDSQRHRACECINVLMDTYLAHLRDEHKRLTLEQITYLNRRQDETADKLKIMLENHASAISSNMSTIEFLFQQQESFSQKIMLIDLELKRLERVGQESVAYYDQMGQSTGNSLVINEILATIRQCKQQCDSIDLAFRNMPSEGSEEMKKGFDAHIAQLDQIRQSSAELQSLKTSLAEQATLSAGPQLSSNPKYMVNEWIEKLNQTQQAWKSATPSQKKAAQSAWESCCSTFRAYLANLERLFEFEQKVLEERLAHQQSPKFEFQGNDLETANQLYNNYSKELSNVEADVVHYQFILDQMQDPEFEPSSLSSVLHDPVSVEIISQTGSLALKLKDDANRSLRELDRLRLDLSQQKSFLQVHVKQTLQLLKLQQKLLQGKLYSIQNAQQDLLQQQISVLEKNLEEFIASRINNLTQEKSVLKQQQEGIKKEMEKMPSKWASEKLIDLYTAANSKMIEEITRQVEVKNISANIDLIRSSPIDIAIPSLHPKRPRLISFSILGALLGLFATFSITLGKAFANGLPATPDNLRLLEQHVAGRLPRHQAISDSKNDLEIYRHLLAYLITPDKAKKGGQTLLLMISQGPDYSIAFTKLMARAGYRLLVLPISFEDSSREQTGTLWQYLEGDVPPKIMHEGAFDRIIPGGPSAHTQELISSSRFQDFLDKVKQQYDWTIVVSRALPMSGEAEYLFNHFNEMAITLTDEKLQEIQARFRLFSEKRVSFLFG